MNTIYRRIFFCLLILPLTLVGCGGDTEAAPADEKTADAETAGGELATEDDKILYALGLAMAQQIGVFGLTEEELAIMRRGLTDGVLGREAAVDLQEYGPKIQEMAQARMAKVAEGESQAAAEFVEKMAAEEGAVRTDSGMIITEITPGEGESPSADSRVTVHYHGTLRDGTVFDSSVDRGQPATFGLNQVIKCWTEGLQRMKVGGKSKLTCPADIAYGPQGRPPKIPGGAALVFEVELLEIAQ